MTDSVVLAVTTCPDEAAAKRVAEVLLKDRLATCVNRIAGVQSSYVWDGRLHDEAEILLMIKTTEDRVTQLEARLKAVHPYELPELLIVPVIGGNERYLEWVRQGVARKEK